MPMLGVYKMYHPIKCKYCNVNGRGYLAFLHPIIISKCDKVKANAIYV